MNDPTPDELPPVTELSPPQRRVLGVLVEKALTTPEYYPLTLKALIGGCNQKSNRSPLTRYDEETVVAAIDELRELGLAAVIHTESGRTERYRHYMRKRFPFTEPQLAIMTELFLRGRQQLGELRSRASRLVPIESLQQLREELDALETMNYVRSNGPLERRGVEVDHDLYPPGEEGGSSGFDTARTADAESTGQLGREQSVSTEMRVTASAADSTARLSMLESATEQLRVENRALSDTVDQLRSHVDRLNEQLEELRQALGG